jgi:signal transduction histidine kinase
LEKEVNEKTAELRKANDELRQLDEAKSEFISIASHQLRTPLTVIKGYISMMQEGSFGAVPPVILNNLNKVYLSNERLIGLVENLLDISRIESGRQEYDWSKIHLEDMAATVVENLKNNAKTKGLKLFFQKPARRTAEVLADANKLHEVMMNFVDNAIKYTKAGEINVSVKAEPKGMVTFCVKDTGMGIAKEIKPYLFRKFSRGKGSFRIHTEGVGLGLYVAKMLIDAHHGKVWAESEGTDKGAQFCFSLPASNPELEKLAKEQAKKAASIPAASKPVKA